MGMGWEEFEKEYLYAPGSETYLLNYSVRTLRRRDLILKKDLYESESEFRENGVGLEKGDAISLFRQHIVQGGGYEQYLNIKEDICNPYSDKELSQLPGGLAWKLKDNQAASRNYIASGVPGVHKYSIAERNALMRLITGMNEHYSPD